MEKLVKAGNELLIVSKPHIECIRPICRALEGFKDRVLFRFTIGSTQNDVLRWWEPGAPPFEERLESLRLAHSEGFATSVSGEPMLDGQPQRLVEAVDPYVSDSVWLGKANQLLSYMAMNHCSVADTERARALLATHSDEFIRGIYRELSGNSKMRWKDSVKKILGLELPADVGMDV